MDNQPVLHIVDSDVSGQGLIKAVAEDLNLTTYCAESGEQFLGRYAPNGPAIIWLEMTLPDRDGLEIMSTLARRYCSDPIVLTTGRYAVYLDWGMKLGQLQELNMIGALMKPFGPETVRQTLCRSIHIASTTSQMERGCGESGLAMASIAHQARSRIKHPFYFPSVGRAKGGGDQPQANPRTPPTEFSIYGDVPYIPPQLRKHRAWLKHYF